MNKKPDEYEPRTLVVNMALTIKDQQEYETIIQKYKHEVEPMKYSDWDCTFWVGLCQQCGKVTAIDYFEWKFEWGDKYNVENVSRGKKDALGYCRCHEELNK